MSSGKCRPFCLGLNVLNAPEHNRLTGEKCLVIFHMTSLCVQCNTSIERHSYDIDHCSYHAIHLKDYIAYVSVFNYQVYWWHAEVHVRGLKRDILYMCLLLANIQRIISLTEAMLWLRSNSQNNSHLTPVGELWMTAVHYLAKNDPEISKEYIPCGLY